MLGLLLVEDVEDRALVGVKRNEFQHFPVVHLAHVHVVVEIERTGMLRRDLLVLKARLRKHERLRADRHFERIEHRAQIAVLRLVAERHGAAIELRLQPRDGVVHVAAVVDRRVAERHEALVAHGNLSARRARDHDERKRGADHADQPLCVSRCDHQLSLALKTKTAREALASRASVAVCGFMSGGSSSWR